MLNDFEIKKIEEFQKRSLEQDKLIFQLRKRIARAEKNILGYSLEGDNGKER